MEPKILFAEDHPFLIDSIKLIFESEGIVDVVEVSTCLDLLRRLEEGGFTHLILDLMLADGDAERILNKISSEYPRLHILVYSTRPSIPFGEALRQKYALDCYISKSESRATAKKHFLAFLKDDGIPSRTPKGAGNPFSSLAPREKEVLPYILEGLPATEIAVKIIIDGKAISADTVRVWKGRILEKTQTKNVLELRDLWRLLNDRI